MDFVKKIIDQYSPDETWKHVNYFLSLGEKWSGTTEEEKQHEYINKICKEFNIPINFYEADAYISYPVIEPPRKPNKEPVLDIIQPENKTIIGIGLAFSGSTPPAGIEGELVFVGAGEPEDYEKINVKDKIVLIELGGFFRGEKVYFAERNGAIGQVHINYLPYQQTGNATMVYGGPTTKTYSNLPNNPIMNIQGEEGEYLKKLLEKDKVYVRMNVECWRGWKKVKIPVVTVYGYENSEKYVMVYGHTDTWFDGATDNVASNSLMLEMAKILQKNKKYLRRSVKFAFWPCHSTGMYSGSTWFVDNFWDDIKENLIALLNMDGIGAKGATDYKSVVHPELFKEHSAILNQLIGNAEVKIKGGGKSGDDSFRGAGIPVINDTVILPKSEREKLKYGNNWWWHTKHDTKDKLDLEGFSISPLKIYLAMIINLCNSQIFPFEFITTGNILHEEFTTIQNEYKNIINIEKMIKLSEIIIGKSKKVNSLINNLPIDSDKIQDINYSLISLSRKLNPILYTEEKYNQDPYSNYKPRLIPKFKILRKLKQLDPNLDEYKALKIELRRNINKINDDLSDAIEILNRILKN
jgi:hypothetical protein